MASNQRSGKADSRNARRSKPKRLRPITAPTKPTIKRLFAVSGNRCAFPACTVPIVDPTTGSILGEICHIEGDKPLAPRHNRTQPPEKRHGFDNLILLCGQHHKVIDDNPKRFTVPHLLKMKRDHEARQPTTQRLQPTQLDALLATLRSPVVVSSRNQQGGQTAHTINNYPQPPSDEDEVRIEASLTIGGDLKLLQRFGSPGLTLTIVCKSKRPARIRNVTLWAEGQGFLASFSSGFGGGIPHTPINDGDTETYSIGLLPITAPDTPEGFTIQRDDARRFYLPLATPCLGVFLTLPPEQIGMRVRFVDDTETGVLTGEVIQTCLGGLMEAYGGKQYKVKVPMDVSVRVTSRSMPRVDHLVGKTNSQHVTLVDAARNRPPGTASGQQVRCELGIAESPHTRERTVGVQIFHEGSDTIQQLSVAFVSASAADVFFVPGAQGPLTPGGARHFALQFRSVPELLHRVQSMPTTAYRIVAFADGKEAWQLTGEQTQRLVAVLAQPPEQPQVDTAS